MTSARPGRFPLMSRRAAFWAVGTVFFLLIFANGAPTPLYGIYQAKWHFSATTLTALFAVYALALLAAQLLHSANLLWGGLAVFLLAGVGSISGVAAARTHPAPVWWAAA